MVRRLCALVALALLALWAAPAAAQLTLFHVGDLVTGLGGPTDSDCLTQEDLERYSSARETCLEGDPDGCQAVKGLEGKNACGFHSDAYVVISVDTAAGIMQISPTGDLTTVYWADVRDFKPQE
jgi:hypothetical protein